MRIHVASYDTVWTCLLTRVIKVTCVELKLTCSRSTTRRVTVTLKALNLYDIYPGN